VPIVEYIYFMLPKISDINTLKDDIIAGIVVFLVALPLCLGIAQASNPKQASSELTAETVLLDKVSQLTNVQSLPEYQAFQASRPKPIENPVNPLAGIIAGIIGGIIIGAVSKSHTSVSGPAAGLTAVVAAGILKLGLFEVFLVSTIIAGALQIVMGKLNWGIIGDYVPNAVIKGMLSAIGILLISKQIPHLIGWDKDPEGDESFQQPDGQNTFSEIIESFNHISFNAAMIGVIGILILILFETQFIKRIKLFKYLPGQLIVVIVGVLLSSFFNRQGNSLESDQIVRLPIFNSIDDIMSGLKSPSWSSFGNIHVWLTGLTVALVASLETLLGIEAVDKIDKFERITPTNHELIAQGLGNMASGLLGGLPLTSVIVRSSANIEAGAKTKRSAIIHGALLLLALLIFPQYLNLIPNSALAAILIFTGYKLAKISLFKQMYQMGWNQFAPFLITIIAILGTDLLKGVIIGMAIGLFFVLKSNYHKSFLIINDGNDYYLKLKNEVSFLDKSRIKNALINLPNGATLIIDTTMCNFMDLDVQEEIRQFIVRSPLSNIKVELNRLNNHRFLFDKIT